MSRELRVGDRVEVFDGSSSCGIRDGKFVLNVDNKNEDRKNLRVCSIGLQIKTRISFSAADTLVTDDNGNYWFIRSDLCHINEKVSKMSRKLKVGDKVRVQDGSYSFGIRDGKYNDVISNVNKDNLTVITVGLNVRKQYSSDYADILITDGNGNYWFVKDRLCEIISKHTIIIDNQSIELSDESYARMKAQFNVTTRTITIDGKDIEMSDESYDNLKKQLLS